MNAPKEGQRILGGEGHWGRASKEMPAGKGAQMVLKKRR